MPRTKEQVWGGCEQGMGAERGEHLVCGARAREKSPNSVSVQSWDPAHSALLVVPWHGTAWHGTAWHGWETGANQASATSLFVTPGKDTEPAVPSSAMHTPLVPELC